MILSISLISFQQGCKQLEPNLQGDSFSKFPMKKSLSKGRFTKEEVAYAKVSPLQQQRRDHINELEGGLLQHPLALYPHLEESIPPDVSTSSFLICFT